MHITFHTFVFAPGVRQPLENYIRKKLVSTFDNLLLADDENALPFKCDVDARLLEQTVSSLQRHNLLTWARRARVRQCGFATIHNSWAPIMVSLVVG